MDRKKMKTYRERLVLKKQEILETYTKNKDYGKHADEEGSQDIADKASNSYAKEFLFSLSNSERDMLQLVEEAIVRLDADRYGTSPTSYRNHTWHREHVQQPWQRACRPGPLVLSAHREIAGRGNRQECADRHRCGI